MLWTLIKISILLFVAMVSYIVLYWTIEEVIFDNGWSKKGHSPEIFEKICKVVMVALVCDGFLVLILLLIKVFWFFN